MAIEEPAFDRIEQVGDFEIRQYRPFIVAETVVDGDMDSATRAGFRLLADYIFGNNLSVGAANNESEKIAMTAPVSVKPTAKSEKIAMTAPVSIAPTSATKAAGDPLSASRRWLVQFSMPSKYTLASLPKPRNPAVTLREVPAKRHAVIAFSGFTGEEKMQQKTTELLAWIQSTGRQAVGVPQLARYNPPWTLPFLRRNEILVEIASPPTP